MLLGKIHTASGRKLNQFYFFWGNVVAVILGYFRIKAATTQREKSAVSLPSPPKSKGHELIS